MRDSIVFYDSWGRMICDLPNDEAATLIKMIFNYTFNDLVSESDDATVNAIFGMIREKLDEDANKWEETRRKRSEGGKKGMSSRWGDKSVITNDNSVIESNDELKEVITPITVSDSVSVSVSDKDKEKDKKESRRFTPPTLKEVSDYVLENGYAYAVNPEAFIDFYQSKGWKVGNNPMKDWKAAVRTWVRRGNAPRAQKSNKFNEYEQNNYDFDALERLMVN